MLGRTSKHWWGVVIDAPDPLALARFYADLMDWKIVKTEDNFVGIAPMGEHVEYFAFQRSAEYVPPVWPPESQELLAGIQNALDWKPSDRLSAPIFDFTYSEEAALNNFKVLADPANAFDLEAILHRDQNS